MSRSTFAAFGFAGVLACVAAPASAQHRNPNRGEAGGPGGSAAPAPRVEQRARPRDEARPAPPQQAPQPAPRAERAIPRDEYRPQYRPQYRPSAPAPRQEDRAIPRGAFRRYDGSGRYYGDERYRGPRYSGPVFSIAPRRFYRPYYVFRPRFSVGLGLWAGYAVAYDEPYYYPYSDTSPIYVQPGQASMGGLSFDISPDTAEVWIDGNYVGEVNQFTPWSQPLGVPAGRHRVELREPGYDVQAFDVDITPGQVIPFQGSLEP